MVLLTWGFTLNITKMFILLLPLHTRRALAFSDCSLVVVAYSLEVVAVASASASGSPVTLVVAVESSFSFAS